jgi:hypothetical protein
VLLSDINYIVKDIDYSSLYKIEYKSINNKLVFNLNLLVFKYMVVAIYKRIGVFKFNYSRFVGSIN